ncbi:MerR family transcriptional regulator [Saccharothrix sp. AJ9571]|nr:MerR family transcriptional regulator [Saccharothrix sp. AJ9571]
MAWSTNQLAELAGTTLKTVRHYHKIGLLEEPERSANGYKQYRVRHLIRLLRIRRLVDLGVPLAGIAAMEESDENAEQTLRELDAELAASIERQQRMRKDLAAVLGHRAMADLPAGFEADVAGVSEANRALLLLCSRIFGPPIMAALQELHSVPPTSVDVDFDALTEEAGEAERQRLAERMVPEAHRHQRDFPSLTDLAAQSPHGAASAMSVVVQGLVELYNPAQVDVLKRVAAFLKEKGTPADV